MKIYFLTNGIFRTAGTERVILQLANTLKNVTILVPESIKCAFLNQTKLDIVSLHANEFPQSGGLKKVFHRYNYYSKLKKNIIFNPEDIVISFAFDLNILNVLLARKYNYRPILCEHIEYNYHNSFRNILRKHFYRQGELVCLTDTDREKFLHDGINAITIPNFIVPVNNTYKSDTKKILAIGRLEYQKNFSLLIEAFASSKLYTQGWSLTIVGEGSQLDDLKQKIKSFELDNFITINKFTNDISIYYREASLLCMTSKFEAFPMVLLEGMNYNLPVLVTDFPTGAREILGELNEQIVHSFDEKIYSRRMLEICSNPSLLERFSNENRELIKKYYPESIVVRWEELLFKR